MGPDFDERTKKLLAHMAGYHCSHLKCQKFTGGPAPVGGTYSTNLGQAAHIKGARPTSARYETQMSDSDRSNISNGIWLCLNHARMIDLNSGKDFSVELLTNWKHAHETKMRLFQEGLPVTSGAITKISIENVLPFTNKIEMFFGKHNIIYGPNSSGKTMICRIFSSFVNYKSGESIFFQSPRDKVGCCHLEFYYNKLFRFELKLIDNRFERFEEGCKISTYPKLFNFLFFQKIKYDQGNFSKENFCETFQLQEENWIEFVQEVGASDLIFFEKLGVSDDRVVYKLPGERYEDTFESGGGAARQLFYLECAIYQAKFFSRTAPTILIIDQEFFDSLDSYWHQKFLHLVINLDIQVFLTLHTLKKGIDYSSFEGWELIRKSQETGATRVKLLDTKTNRS